VPLPANPSVILKQALTVNGDEFVETVESAINLLREENGRIGSFTVAGRLVKLDAAGEAVVVGDLHGDLDSLTSILHSTGFTQRMAKNKDAAMIFLGDYGDRGAYSAEVYYALLRLKLAFPEQVILLRGNHEGPVALMASPHDLPLQFQRRFRQKGAAAYAKTRELWAYLYTAVLVDGRCLMVHGGLPSALNSVDVLARAHETHPKQEFLEELLWSDPDDMVKDVASSPRGAGKLFGKSVTERVLAKLNVKVLIRGHEPCGEGFRINHEGKVLTLFSRKGEPYFNAYGAYLDLPLHEKFENAVQLLPWVRRF
jgi:hypothetical protein